MSEYQGRPVNVQRVHLEGVHSPECCLGWIQRYVVVVIRCPVPRPVLFAVSLPRPVSLPTEASPDLAANVAIAVR